MNSSGGVHGRNPHRSYRRFAWVGSSFDYYAAAPGGIQGRCRLRNSPRCCALFNEAATRLVFREAPRDEYPSARRLLPQLDSGPKKRLEVLLFIYESGVGSHPLHLPHGCLSTLPKTLCLNRSVGVGRDGSLDQFFNRRAYFVVEAVGDVDGPADGCHVGFPPVDPHGFVNGRVKVAD